MFVNSVIVVGCMVRDL